MAVVIAIGNVYKRGTGFSIHFVYVLFIFLNESECSSAKGQLISKADMKVFI